MKIRKKEPTLNQIAVSLLASAALLLPLSAAAQATTSPVPEKPASQPQIELDGTGIATLTNQSPPSLLASGAKGSASRLDVSDSSLLLGISQRLYRGAVGSLVAGVTSTDENDVSSKTNLFLSQLYLDYQGKKLESYIGRTGTPAHLFDFPTLRGSDLNEFVNIPNPFSNGVNSEETRYANVAALEFNSKLRYFFNIHAQHLLQTDGPDAGQTGINSYGLTFRYEAPPLLTDLVKVPLWGLGYERQTIGSAQGGASNLLYGGIIYNIAPDPMNRVDLRLQDIYSFSNGLHTLGSYADTYRAAGNSIAASLRFLHSPAGIPGYELALTAGYRSYADISGASTYALSFLASKRLGDGFDVIAQYTFQHRSSLYAGAVGAPRDENRIEVGFVFNFQSTFNQHIGPRRTLPNLQHQYIPE